MLFKCCADAEDGEPTLKQHCVNSSCLLGAFVSCACRGHLLTQGSLLLGSNEPCCQEDGRGGLIKIEDISQMVNNPWVNQQCLLDGDVDPGEGGGGGETTRQARGNPVNTKHVYIIYTTLPQRLPLVLH